LLFFLALVGGGDEREMASLEALSMGSSVDRFNVGDENDPRSNGQQDNQDESEEDEEDEEQEDALLHRERPVKKFYRSYVMMEEDGRRSSVFLLSRIFRPPMMHS